MSNLTIIFPRVPESYAYLTFCELRRNRSRSKGDKSTQVHHIVPKCLGGTDEKENLVVLTNSEHYRAHYLLCKIFPKNYGLRYALNLMSKECTSPLEYEEIISNRPEVPLETRLKLSESTKRLWEDPEYRERVTKNNKGKKRSKETKIKCSKAAKERWKNYSPEIKESITRKLTKMSQEMSEETKKKMSISHTGKKLSEAHIKAASEGRKNKEVWKHFDYLFQVWLENGMCTPGKLHKLTKIGNSRNSLKTMVEEFKNKI